MSQSRPIITILIVVGIAAVVIAAIVTTVLLLRKHSQQKTTKTMSGTWEVIKLNDLLQAGDHTTMGGPIIIGRTPASVTLSFSDGTVHPLVHQPGDPGDPKVIGTGPIPATYGRLAGEATNTFTYPYQGTNNHPSYADRSAADLLLWNQHIVHDNKDVSDNTYLLTRVPESFTGGQVNRCLCHYHE